MLSYTELKPKVVIVHDGEPYEVVSTSGVVKKQRQKPHNTAKMRNLKTGSTVEKTFTQADKIEEAELETKDIKYLYTNKGESWFCDPNNPKDRNQLPESLIAEQLPYMRENDIVEALVFDEEVLKVRLPAKVELKVVEAPPNIKGNTAQGGTKQVTLETGLVVSVPMFINEGDVLRVNTDTAQYVERA